MPKVTPINNKEQKILREITKGIGSFPTKVATPMTSKRWTCSKCKKVYNSLIEVKSPSPCICGSIFFEK